MIYEIPDDMAYTPLQKDHFPLETALLQIYAKLLRLCH